MTRLARRASLSLASEQAQKRRSMRHGVCSNDPWRPIRIMRARLRRCPWTHVHAYVEPFDGDYARPAALDRALGLAEIGALRRSPAAGSRSAWLGVSLQTPARCGYRRI